MPVTKLSISLQPRIMAELEKRAEYDNISGAINKSLERYYSLLGRARAELRSRLSDAECALILDALNGSLFADTSSISMIWAEIEDACSLDSLYSKWEVDGEALVAKLRSASLIEAAALVDGSERWWNRVAAGETPPFSHLLDDYRPGRYPLTMVKVAKDLLPPEAPE